MLLGAVTGLTRKQEALEQNRRKVSSPVLQRKQQQQQQQSAEEEYQEDEEEVSDRCPEPNGYFPDAGQCDKYYDCRDGKYIEKLCPDGLVFNDFSPQHEKCDLPFGIDCSKRPKLRKAIAILFEILFPPLFLERRGKRGARTRMHTRVYVRTRIHTDEKSIFPPLHIPQRNRNRPPIVQGCTVTSPTRTQEYATRSITAWRGSST